MTNSLPDPRLHAYRPDLAAAGLRGQIAAPRYADGTTREVRRAAVPVRRQPDNALGLDTEALFGERITVYEEANGWAWGQLERDSYVGYLPADALGPPGDAPTHRIAAIGTFLYSGEDIKSPPVMHLSLTSPIVVVEHLDRFSRLQNGTYVISRHISPLDRYARDFVDIAERLIGVPYLWGGRTRIGLDCSGLVQLALAASGIAAPRDTDMQQAALGQPVPEVMQEPQSGPAAGSDGLDNLLRGDLVFWRGHVGMMSDSATLLHANAHHMAVVSEPLASALTRISASGSEIVAIRRLPARPA